MFLYSRVPSLIPLLHRQIQGLKDHFPDMRDILGVMLTGSCSSGQATYRSDVDLLVILRDGPLNFGRVREIRDTIEMGYRKQNRAEFLNDPLPIQITVVLKSVFSTSEPAMKEA